MIAAAIAGCGGSDAQPPSGAGPSGLQTTARQADCTDWNNANVEQRLATIRGIAAVEGGAIPNVESDARGATLSDKDAYALFESWCRNRFARGFKLYKLYGRAAAFSKYRGGGR